MVDMRGPKFLSIPALLLLAAVVVTVALASKARIASRAAESDGPVAEILYLNNRGVALLDQYKFKEAAEQFRRIIEIEPRVLPAHVNLGIAYFYDQQYDSAMASLKKVREMDPDNIRAHFVLGLIFRNQDEVEKAIEAFEAVNRLDPRDPSTNYYLGRLRMRLRDYEKAGAYFRTVIEQEPYNASAHYNLATALSRGGRPDEGRRGMEEFRRLQDLFGSTTVGLQYLEQGQYAIAIDNIPERYLPGFRPESTPRIQVTFREVAAEVGLRFDHGGPGRSDPRFASRRELEESIVPFMGSGIAAADYDGDGWMDLYIANAGPGGAKGSLFRNRGNGTFQDATAGSGLAFSGKTMHAFWGDYGNDGYPDLYLVNYGPNVLYRNRGDGTFEDVTAETGTGDPSWGMGGGFVDFDHDGDLDILVVNFATPPQSVAGSMTFPSDLTGAPNVLYRNNGDGTFTEIGQSSKLAGGNLRTTAFLAADLDNTRDVDFFLVNQGADNQLWNNLRDGTFERVTELAAKGTGYGVGIGAGDLNANGLMDLALPSLRSGETRFFQNLGHDRYELHRVVAERVRGPVLNIQFFDYDNDGDLDVLVLSAPLFGDDAESPGRNLHLFQNRDGELVDVSAEVGLDRVSGKAIRGLAIADFDNDGDLDFVINVNGGPPLLFRNEGGNQNNWISLRLVGTNSNKSGIGAKAEVQAGRLWRKQEFFGGQGFQTHHSPILHFGLGRRQRADVVRVIWPNGVLQSEIDTPANQVVEVQELDRKGTSCPILYVWNGETYQFQTDFLGGSAYGSLLAPGVFNYPDSDEYIKLNRADVALKDGRLAITMNNQLEEVILFDLLELVVVDHPAEYEIYPDEKLLPGPPYQDFRILVAEDARPPVGAWDGQGRDALDAVRKIDRIYPEVPNTLPFKGYTDMQELVLDLGEVSNEYAVLLMHAWIDYADSSSNLAASQAGIELVPPYLQVEDREGRWVTAIERMGFPAGLPKTMTVDLSGVFRSESRRVRIVTNMKIYWDRILVADGHPRDDYRLHRLTPESAELGYRGYPKFASLDGRDPKVYFYDQDSPAEWKVHVGAYTRFGDVLPLLQEKDDMFVITRSGDEIKARFDLRELPPLPEGWVRDYLVYVDGYGKDMDPNSAAPHFLGPLPFQNMSSYPYPESERYPDTPGHQEYLRTWNTRIFARAVPDLLEGRRAED
jgi:Flp pilus assembly protein TadD